MQAGSKQEYSAREEIAHAVTHGIGALLSVAALVLLIVRASSTGDVWRVVSFSIFGTSMVLLYTASTLYHSFSRTDARMRLKVFDHAMIYVLIAGSYTPFLLITLRGAWGWSLFGVLWGMTLMGISFKVFFIGRFPRMSTLLYLTMGWVGVIAAKPMYEALPGACLGWLLAGGLFYSLGTIFYTRESLKYHHAVWHLFVLAGTCCHFQSVYGYLA
ncbi:MAG: hemolysin III [Planctomycetota bacterium]|jgi:hemolysin III